MVKTCCFFATFILSMEEGLAPLRVKKTDFPGLGHGLRMVLHGVCLPFADYWYRTHVDVFSLIFAGSRNCLEYVRVILSLAD